MIFTLRSAAGLTVIEVPPELFVGTASTWSPVTVAPLLMLPSAVVLATIVSVAVPPELSVGNVATAALFWDWTFPLGIDAETRLSPAGRLSMIVAPWTGRGRCSRSKSRT